MSSRLIQYFVSVHRYALAGRFFRLGSTKTNKAEAAKLRGNGDMEGNAVLADAHIHGGASAKHIPTSKLSDNYNTTGCRPAGAFAPFSLHPGARAPWQGSCRSYGALLAGTPRQLPIVCPPFPSLLQARADKYHA
jgi:hypothetical protein